MKRKFNYIYARIRWKEQHDVSQYYSNLENLVEEKVVQVLFYFIRLGVQRVGGWWETSIIIGASHPTPPPVVARALVIRS